MILSFKRFFYLLLILILSSCGNYSFTGASIPEGTETFQVNLFENNSGNNVGSIFEPGLDRDFTIALHAIPIGVTSSELEDHLPSQIKFYKTKISIIILNTCKS